MVGSDSGLRNVVVDLMLIVGTHSLKIIGKRCRQKYRKSNIRSTRKSIKYKDENK